VKFDLGGNKKIEFKTDITSLVEVAPVKPAKFFLPQWFKSMNDSFEKPTNPDGPPNKFGKKGEIAKKWREGTVKRCPAVVDLMAEGYIIPMWADFLAQRNKELFEYDNTNFPYGVDFHSAQQIYNWPLKKTDFPEAVKFVNPWRIYTPKGYSVLFTQPTYQFERRFTVLPGIVETDSYHHINFPTIWHTTKDTIIERGTPFIQVIPFKRDSWDFSSGAMNEQDKEEDQQAKYELSTTFKNSYRSLTQRFKDKG